MRVLATLALLTLVKFSEQVDYCDKKLCPHKGPNIACNAAKILGTSCEIGGKLINMTVAHQALLVDMHNMFRSKIATGKQNYNSTLYYPQAAKMTYMKWDPELAFMAEANARTCVYGHDACRNTPTYRRSGQNLFSSMMKGKTVLETDVLKEGLNDWYSEFVDCTPNIIASYPRTYSGKDIGHFTQIVADHSNRVGCAMVRYLKDSWTTYYLVCNYALTNMVGQPVYVAGTACSKCTTGCSTVYPGLCNAQEPSKYN